MYIFNHIPKCAGLSYRALLEDVFGKERVEHITINQEEEYHPNPADYAQFTMLMGHFGVRWNEILAPGRRWMTALREPVDRVVSTYYYWRYNAPPSPESPWLYLAQTLSLDDFVRSGHFSVLQGIKDAQTWLLADDLRWRYHSVPDKDALAIAKANLDQFDFVGLYEDFDESMKRMCAYLGVPLRPRVPRVNVTKKRPAVSDLSPATIDAIMGLNAADIELYNYARQKFYHPASQPPAANGRPALMRTEPTPQTAQMLPISFEGAEALRTWIVSMPSSCPPGGVMDALIEVFNGGAETWSSAPPNPLFLSYHWFTERDETCLFDGWRSEIRPVLTPFSGRRYRMHIAAPPAPGRYKLRVTLVQEYVRWFDELGTRCMEERWIDVKPTSVSALDMQFKSSAVRI